MTARPYKLIAALITATWLAVPAPALAAVSANAQSAASAGVQYLKNNEGTDGKISGFGGESEWSAVAVRAAGLQAASFSHGGASLLDFLESDVPDPGASATTIERSIIAIAAAGQDPSDFGGVDYLSLLDSTHIGGQIGDPTLLNDDIFGIIAVDAAQDPALVPEAQDALSYLLARQQAGGGFSYTTDTCAWCGPDSGDTAAAIVAMYAASDLGLGSPAVDTARSEALTYLLSTQQPDGGFGGDPSGPSDGSSTSWALIALNTIGDSAASAASSARDWLLKNQNPDGGFSYGAYGYTASDTYTTAGAVTALLGTSWLLRPQPTPIPATGGGSSTPPTLSSSGASGKTAQKPPVQPATASPPKTTVTTTVYRKTVPRQTDKPKKDGGPQVKAASITDIKKTPLRSYTSLDRNKKPGSRSVYFIAVLGIIAIMWFVIESQKAVRRDNS